ncbi:AarF/UbiB family protein, partial [Pseudomonas syringae pv. tagetis]|uniref:AarF/UbiB family protein n=1 Tax=Pseudomonas syringae group genomosp. 7 TaxID=251699 RepID=UPI00376FDD8A
GNKPSYTSRSSNETVCMRLLEMFYGMVFRDGIVHSDLHPGNILICGGSEICLLDFGLVLHLTVEQKKDFREFFWCMASRDA